MSTDPLVTQHPIIHSIPTLQMTNLDILGVNNQKTDQEEDDAPIDFIPTDPSEKNIPQNILDFEQATEPIEKKEKKFDEFDFGFANEKPASLPKQDDPMKPNSMKILEPVQIQEKQLIPSKTDEGGFDDIFEEVVPTKPAKSPISSKISLKKQYTNKTNEDNDYSDEDGKYDDSYDDNGGPVNNYYNQNYYGEENDSDDDEDNEEYETYKRNETVMSPKTSKPKTQPVDNDFL